VVGTSYSELAALGPKTLGTKAMKSTGQNKQNSGYKVLLLLVVGLTAFSSAMKDLSQLHHFALDASHLMAEWSDKFYPAQDVPPIPQTAEIQPAAIKAEVCELKQSVPSVELPWLSNAVARPAEPKPPRAVTPRPSQVIDFKSDLPLPGEIQIAKLKRIPQIDIDAVQFNFRIANGDEPDVFVTTDLPKSEFKNRARKHREIRFNPRDREMFLKTLNRSINLRFAS
jgi:hypothetical protein